MTGLLIKNAVVFDPVNGIRGERMDIAIRDGRIVEDAGPGAREIDAGGLLTMPGGIDSHSHVCGTKVNFGRYMSPEDMRAGRTARRGSMHVTSGYSVPTTFGNSYRYSAMGYTMVLEGAMAPLEARHTHEEFTATPHQDMLANTLFDGNWAIMEAVREGDIKRAAAVVAWTLSAVKGFAIKLTNPGGTEAWGWGEDLRGIHDPVPNFGVTPADIISTLIQANEMLRMKGELTRILAHHTGQTVERVGLDTERDFFMTAGDAKEYGILDHVIAKRPQMPKEGEEKADAKDK